MTRIEPEEQDFDPETFTAEDAERAYRGGVQLFNAGEYHAAHEQFERCWLADESGDADFFKGLIQACICLHHLGRDNADGAKKLYQGHRRLLGPFLPAHRGLDLERFLADVQRFLRPVLAGAGEPPPETQRPRMSLQNDGT